MVGLPPGSFPLPIFDVVLKRLTVRGSIVGTRQDLAEALMFAADGKVSAEVESRRLDEINAIFADLKAARFAATLPTRARATRSRRLPPARQPETAAQTERSPPRSACRSRRPGRCR